MFPKELATSESSTQSKSAIENSFTERRQFYPNYSPSIYVSSMMCKNYLRHFSSKCQFSWCICCIGTYTRFLDLFSSTLCGHTEAVLSTTLCPKMMSLHLFLKQQVISFTADLFGGVVADYWRRVSTLVQRWDVQNILHLLQKKCWIVSILSSLIMKIIVTGLFTDHQKLTYVFAFVSYNIVSFTDNSDNKVDNVSVLFSVCFTFWHSKWSMDK